MSRIIAECEQLVINTGIDKLADAVETAQATAETVNQSINGGYSFAVDIISGNFSVDEVSVDIDTFIQNGESQTFTYNGNWSPSLSTWGVTITFTPTDDDSFHINISDISGLSATVLEHENRIADTEGNLSDINQNVENAQSIINEYLGENGYISISKDPQNPYLEIGKNVSGNRFYVILSSTEMGFYQDVEKVAYINDSILHIENGQMGQSLDIGNFQFANRSGRLTLKHK